MKQIYLLVSQHFDLLWRQSEGRYRTIRRDVIDALLDLMKRHEAMKVFFVQGIELMDYFEDRPARKRAFRKYLQQGRIELATGGLSLIDLNLVTGESIVRNLVAARRYFQQEFGVTPTSACLADAFGACGQVPQILRQSGLSSVSGIRYVGIKDKLQYGDYGAFHWKGLDGSSVLAYENAMGALDVDCLHAIYGWGIMEGYDDLYDEFLAGKADAETPHRIASLTRQLQTLRGTVIPLNISGEQHIPRAEVIEEILKQRPVGMQFRFATPSEYEAAVRKCGDIPTIEGEMNPEFTGCYTSRQQIKLLNRQLETELQSRESLVTLRRLVRGKSGRPLFGQSYRDLYLIQFHDSLGGCHIDNNYRLLLRLGRRIRQDLDRKVPLGKRRVAVRRFNPLPWKRIELLEVPARSNGPTQRHGRRRVALVALPAMGACVPAESVVSRPNRYNVRCTSRGVVITDTLLDWKVFTDRLPMPRIIAREDTGTLWTEEYSGKSLAEQDNQLVEHHTGEVFERLLFRSELRGATWPGMKRLHIEKELLVLPDWIDVTLRLDFQGKASEIAVFFPVATDPRTHRALFSTPFGEEIRQDYLPKMKRRADGRSVKWGRHARGNWPALYYVTSHDHRRGLTLANRGTGGTRITSEGITISLLRSPTDSQVPAFPVPPTPQSHCNGLHTFEFRLFTHTSRAIPRRQAMAFSYPPLRVPSGVLPGDASVAVDAENILFSSLKPAESGQGAILRLYESAGRATEAKLTLPPTIRAVQRVDLNEEHPEPVRNNSVHFRPFEIVTLRLQPAGDGGVGR